MHEAHGGGGRIQVVGRERERQLKLGWLPSIGFAADPGQNKNYNYSLKK